MDLKFLIEGMGQMKRGFSRDQRIRDHRYLRPALTQVVIMGLIVKSNGTYLDAVEWVFHAEIAWELSGINVEERQVNIGVFDTLAKTGERIS